MSRKLTRRPWESNDAPPLQTVETITVARPGSEKEQEAELMTMVTTSRRRRVRKTEDGQTVLEEQDLLFTQRKTVWKKLAEDPTSNDMGTKQEVV